MRIRASRPLRARNKIKPTKTEQPVKPDPMAGYQATSGGSQVERRAARYENWDGCYRETPIIMGFRPNEETNR